jgi:hypothetical protein
MIEAGCHLIDFVLISLQVDLIDFMLISLQVDVIDFVLISLQVDVIDFVLISLQVVKCKVDSKDLSFAIFASQQTSEGVRLTNLTTSILKLKGSVSVKHS